MDKIIENILDGLVSFAGKLFFSIVIIVVGFKLVGFLMKKIQNGRGFKRLEKSSQTFISSILGITFKVIVSIIAITTLGIPMTSIVAIIGSAGLALGLALQGGLSNIAGGVMIMIFKPFKVGDYIDTHADSGTVKEINIFHTVLTTIDNKIVVLPNGELSNSVIVNYTAMKNRRLDLDFSVDYTTDIDKVKKVLYKVAEESKYLLKDKEVFVGLKEHADSALIFTLRMWVRKDDYWNARFEILEQVKKAFDKSKISIPYPQLDVHLDK